MRTETEYLPVHSEAYCHSSALKRRRSLPCCCPSLASERWRASLSASSLWSGPSCRWRSSSAAMSKGFRKLLLCSLPEVSVDERRRDTLGEREPLGFRFQASNLIVAPRNRQAFVGWDYRKSTAVTISPCLESMSSASYCSTTYPYHLAPRSSVGPARSPMVDIVLHAATIGLLCCNTPAVIRHRWSRIGHSIERGGRWAGSMAK
jgi:hypothetical protein